MADKLEDKHRQGVLTRDDLNHLKQLATDPEKLSMGELIRVHLSEEERSITKQHLLDKKRFLEQFVTCVGRHTFADNVTRKQAGDYVRNVIGVGALSRRSKEKHLFTLNSFFRWTRRSGFTESNPFDDMTRLLGSPGQSTRVQKKPYSASELGLLFPNLTEKLYPLCLIALYSGLRIEEICQLRIEDVNEGFEINQGKTRNSIRVVPIHSMLKATVEGLKLQSSDGYLIPNLKPAGRGEKRSHNISKQFGRTKSKLGFSIEHDFHSLRRTFATAMENIGVPETTIEQLMGHAKQSLSLNIYSGGVEFSKLKTEIEKMRFHSLDWVGPG